MKKSWLHYNPLKKVLKSKKAIFKISYITISGIKKTKGRKNVHVRSGSATLLPRQSVNKFTSIKEKSLD
jgi:hypothetical protein